MQEHTVIGATTTQGHALRIAEERKMAAHNVDCQAVGITFVLMAVETLGGWNEEAVHTIGQIGKLLGQRSGSSPAETTHHLFQRLWRANVNMWLGHLPSNSASLDGNSLYMIVLFVFICIYKKFVLEKVQVKTSGSYNTTTHQKHHKSYSVQAMIPCLH